MRTMKHWALAAAAAAALALAGCGGGGGSSSSGGPTGTTDPPKTALSYATNLNTAVAKLTTLSGADDADGSALMMAKEASEKIGVVASGGDSSAAMMSAQAVIDARTMLMEAVTAATKAKTAAMEEKAKLSADDDADVIAALDNAITAADTQIKAAQALLDAKATVMGSLASYVQMVTGTDGDEDAADRGREVANAIYDALATAAQVPAPVAFPTGHTPSATIGKLVMGPSDAQGKTWAEIGGPDLMDTRIVTGGPSGGTRAVMAKSVAGMTADKLGQSSTPAIADGTEVAGTYKGIAGTLFCAGDDCGVEHADGTTFVDTTSKLTGSWYFAPTAASTTTYVAGTTADTYTAEVGGTDYVQYGYWLSVASATDDTTTINRYLTGPIASANVYGVDASIDAFSGTSARYTGKAVGMSVIGTGSSRASGGFTADVNLTMKFGASPSLEGMIRNFMGSAVDSSWSVDLDNAALASGAVTAGVTDGGGTEGSWTATAWGGDATPGSEARPKGVYGAFDANFTNGAAAGVYATRKQ